ncbi:MAG TPA: thiamine pyrophosphate-binding protein, partial [Symbiobacteriaceae bacterium]|nr:thiamine pyrophosphate-binding protein [Symbiobacteriaceae bacterium]
MSAPSVAQALLDHWHSWGVTTLFAIPGAQVDGLLMEAASDGRFQIILAAHEQGAGYMADGFARLSGVPGIVIAINGPGATNLTTAAITAQADHSPVLFLTGDAPAVLAGYGGFQGSDPHGSNPNPVLKAALTNAISITTPDILPTALRLSERLMTGPAPGPLY